MKKLIVIVALCLSSCTVQLQDTEARQIINQHATVLDAISGYVKQLQDKGVLPKPEQEAKK